MRPAELQRLGLRRLGSTSGSGGLPYDTPLTPNAVVFINAAGTKATTSTQLLYKDPGTGSKTFAVLNDATTLQPTDDACFVVKKTSGRVTAIFDGGGFSNNLVQLKNGGGGTRDSISSDNVNGFQIGTSAAGGLDQSGITMDPGTAGNAFMTIATDQIQMNHTKLGFFSTTPVSQQLKTTTGPAGGTYNATAQAMLNNCFNALRAYGLLL